MSLLGDIFKSKDQREKEWAEREKEHLQFIAAIEPILLSLFGRFKYEKDSSPNPTRIDGSSLFAYIRRSNRYAKDVWRYCLTLDSLNEEFDYPKNAPSIEYVRMLGNYSLGKAEELAPQTLYGTARIQFTDAQKAKFLKIVRQDYGPGLAPPEAKLVDVSNAVIDSKFEQFEALKARHKEVSSKLSQERSRTAILFGVDEKRKNVESLGRELNHIESAINHHKSDLSEELSKYRSNEDWWRSKRGISLENALSAFFQEEGFQVKSTPGSGDGGIDLFLEAFGITYIIQCKGWSEKVGVATVRDMAGVLSMSEKGTRAIIIAPNGFTDGAITFATQSGVQTWTASHLARFKDLRLL